MPAFDRWHVGLSKLQWRHAIRRQTRVAGLTAGLANRPLENDRQTRRSPRPARHKKRMRAGADHRLRDSLSKNCYAGRQTRLPLVRQRANYSDGGSAESWIIDSRAATVGRSRSTLRQWSVTLKQSNVRVKHWRSTVRGSSVSVKASPFDGLRLAPEAHTVERHCLKIALHGSRVELHSPTLELHGLGLALHAWMLRAT